MQTLKTHLIKLFCTLATLAGIAGLGAPGSIGAEPPKPGKEEQVLAATAGQWEYEGVGQESPFYPAGKFAGKETVRMILNGFFVEADWTDTSESGYTAMGKVIVSYDRAAKAYRESNFEGDGTISHGTLTVSEDGRTWTSMSKRKDREGKEYDIRYVSTFAADGKLRKGKCEYSSDGKKTWKLMYELTSKRVK